MDDYLIPNKNYVYLIEITIFNKVFIIILIPYTVYINYIQHYVLTYLIIRHFTHISNLSHEHRLFMFYKLDHILYAIRLRIEAYFCKFVIPNNINNCAVIYRYQFIHFILQWMIQ